MLWRSLGRLLLLVVIELPERVIAWKLYEHRTSLYKVTLQVFGCVHCGNQASAMFFNQLENRRHIFIIVSLPVVKTR